MVENRTPPLKVLVSGLDENAMTWLKTMVREKKLPWRLRSCEPLRVGAPDSQVENQDIIIIAWGRPQSATASEILKNQEAPKYRSLEGVLATLEDIGGELLCARTVVFGRAVTREDALLLAEHGIRLVLPLPEKQSSWKEFGNEFCERVYKLHNEETTKRNQPVERVVARFMALLTSWPKLADEVKMKAVDDLLNCLGDSSRYAELVARKCLRESDFEGAEKWLNRSLAKNPTYLKSLHLLSDLYMKTERVNDALTVLDKVKANSPRSIKTLTKIGRCYAAKNEPQKAEKYLYDALAIDEYHPLVREELGKVKFAMQEFESARKLLATSQSPREVATHLNKVGIQMVEQGRYQSSIEHYRWAQFVLPGNEQAHLLFFNIALAYAKWGKISEAMSYARLAKTRTPDYEKASQLVQKLERFLKSATAA